MNSQAQKTDDNDVQTLKIDEQAMKIDEKTH